MNWVLVAGLIRNPETALHQAAQVRDLMQKGLVAGAVLSTWHGELERHPAVARAFGELGTVFVESPQPLLRFPGHVLHQSLALQFGLDFIPDDARVLRVRPDVAPLNPAIAGVLGGDRLTRDLGFGVPTAFRHRIWCIAGLLDWPFYINDILFYGDKADVARLARIDLTMEWRYSELAPEQFFHLGPVAAVNPVLDLYARVQRGHHGPAENRRRAEVMWDCDFWYDVLLATARELLANYCTGFADPGETLGESSMEQFTSLPLRALFEPGTPVTHVHPHGQVGGNTFHALHWAKAVIEGRFRHDGHSARLDRARARDLAEVRNNAEDCAERMRDAFRLPLPPLRGAPAGMARRPEKPVNVQAQLDGDYTRQLEAEVSQLRRLVEASTKVDRG